MLAFLSKSSEELLEDSSQLSPQIGISQLQVNSRTEVQRASADPALVFPCRLPITLKGLAVLRKSLVATYSIIMDLI